MTYANLPYVHCLAPEGEEVEGYDIAVVGAPFDTVSKPLFLSQFDHVADELFVAGYHGATRREVRTFRHPAGFEEDFCAVLLERLHWSASSSHQSEYSSTD